LKKGLTAKRRAFTFKVSGRDEWAEKKGLGQNEAGRLDAGVLNSKGAI